MTEEEKKRRITFLELRISIAHRNYETLMNKEDFDEDDRRYAETLIADIRNAKAEIKRLKGE